MRNLGEAGIPQMAPQSVRWCFTLFQYELPLFTEKPDWCEFIVYQEEESPSTGKKHIQGFVILKNRLRQRSVKKLLGETAHVEPARGNNQSCRDYCRKVATRKDGPWEYGICVNQGSNKRKTMELYEEDPAELRLADPKLYRRCLAEKTNTQFHRLVLPLHNRLWQRVLEEELNKGSDDRTILWVYGSKGSEGKTTWAKKKIQEGWFYSRGGKAENIKYEYVEHLGHAIFDIPRQSEDNLQYTVLEEIKDRLIRSSKYEPLAINAADTVHVVVLANFKPQMEDQYDSRGRKERSQMLSRDRVVVINIDSSEVQYGDGTSVVFQELVME